VIDVVALTLPALLAAIDGRKTVPRGSSSTRRARGD
jgi:hypothetical protein